MREAVHLGEKIYLKNKINKIKKKEEGKEKEKKWNKFWNKKYFSRDEE